MRCIGLYVDNAARSYRVVLRSDSDFRLSADDVVHFVLRVRALPVLGSSRERVDPAAHGGDAQKFVVRRIVSTPLGRKRICLEGLHRIWKEAR